MALRIHDIPITSNRMFKEHFKLEDVYPLLKLIISKEGDNLFTSKEDSIVLALLRDSCKDSFSLPQVLVEADKYVVNYKDERIVLKSVSTDVLIESVEQFQAVLLCLLGGTSITHDELSCFVTPKNENGKLKEGAVVVLRNNDRREFQLFPYSKTLRSPIYTIAIQNQSTLAGVAHVLICNDEGKIIDDVRLRNNSVIFANCTNGCLIELLPQFSASCDHYNYFDFNKRPHTLCRKVVDDDEGIYVYRTDYTSKITQFTSDDERGVIGVKDGRLFIMSNIFNPMTDFQFKLEDAETIVKVEVKGEIYIALTNKGRTFSNFKAMKLKNIVSVGISESGVPYAISSEGCLIIGSPTEPVTTENNVYAVYSIDADSKSVKRRDGVIALSQGQTRKDTGKVMLYKGRFISLDSSSGNLLSSNSSSPLARDVLDYKLLKYGLNGSEGLVVYDGSNVVLVSIQADSYLA